MEAISYKPEREKIEDGRRKMEEHRAQSIELRVKRLGNAGKRKNLPTQ